MSIHDSGNTRRFLNDAVLTLAMEQSLMAGGVSGQTVLVSSACNLEYARQKYPSQIDEDKENGKFQGLSCYHTKIENFVS
jgi:hypothetical protein